MSATYTKLGEKRGAYFMQFKKPPTSNPETIWSVFGLKAESHPLLQHWSEESKMI